MSYMQPVVNLNGTSREELINQRLGFSAALMDVITALSNMSPQMRDYRDATEWQRDRAIYVERFRALDRLYSEVIEEVASLSEQPV